MLYIFVDILDVGLSYLVNTVYTVRVVRQLKFDSILRNGGVSSSDGDSMDRQSANPNDQLGVGARGNV